MKIYLFAVCSMVLLSTNVGAATTAADAQVKATPLDEYVTFLNEKIAKMSGEVASTSTQVEQLKKTVADLEQKRTAAQKTGTVGALAGNDQNKSLEADYNAKKQELDGLTERFTRAADELASMKRQKELFEYLKNKMAELEEIMSGVAQADDDAATIAALLSDDDNTAEVEDAKALA